MYSISVDLQGYSLLWHLHTWVDSWVTLMQSLAISHPYHDHWLFQPGMTVTFIVKSSEEIQDFYYGVSYHNKQQMSPYVIGSESVPWHLSTLQSLAQSRCHDIYRHYKHWLRVGAMTSIDITIIGLELVPWHLSALQSLAQSRFHDIYRHYNSVIFQQVSTTVVRQPIPSFLMQH